MSTPVEFPVKAITRKCPICAKPTLEAYKPFCSKRCADVDLNRWLNGIYAVPDDDDDARPDSQGQAPEEDQR